MHQCELFINNVESEVAAAIIDLRKQIRACERKIYEAERRVIKDKQRVNHVVAINPDGTINFTVEKVRRKLNKVYSLRKEGLYHLYKAYYFYQDDLEILYQYINLYLRPVQN
ncbi:MAG: hypothetical protein P8L69_00685 [Alphaproteobacteria bacterium]|nr:hypothetical protein [Alphaproteobacteria bacterium]